MISVLQVSELVKSHQQSTVNAVESWEHKIVTQELPTEPAVSAQDEEQQVEGNSHSGAFLSDCATATKSFETPDISEPYTLTELQPVNLQQKHKQEYSFVEFTPLQRLNRESSLEEESSVHSSTAIDVVPDGQDIDVDEIREESELEQLLFLNREYQVSCHGVFPKYLVCSHEGLTFEMSMVIDVFHCVFVFVCLFVFVLCVCFCVFFLCVFET